jgi:DNA-binding transcriptional MerR regulator
MEDKEYSIQELAELSGVARRNIYFYTQQGILPPPQGAGLAAHYNEIHLLRLRALPLLRAEGLRLDQIRLRLETIMLDDLRVLAEQNPAPNPPRVSFSKMDVNLQKGSTGLFPGVRRMLRYDLPGGIELAVPQDLDPAIQPRLEALLLEAVRILNGKEEI